MQTDLEQNETNRVQRRRGLQMFVAKGLAADSQCLAHRVRLNLHSFLVDTEHRIYPYQRQEGVHSYIMFLLLVDVDIS
jgi:hypothetical protein